MLLNLVGIVGLTGRTLISKCRKPLNNFFNGGGALHEFPDHFWTERRQSDGRAFAIVR